MASTGRVFNFYPGPAALPVEIIEKARDELLDFSGTGMSIMETSHRSKEYEAVHNEAIGRIKALLGVGDEFTVLFLQGGASLQFAAVPMNFLGPGKTADIIMTGSWSEKALKEAKLHGSVNIAATSEKDGKYTRVPKQEELKLTPGAAYCHYTSNNTIFGTQFHYTPDAGDVPLAADMSSDIFSRRFEVKRHGIIYAGAQKNTGPAGITVVIIRRDFLEKARDDIPIILKYKTHEGKNSLYNTPPCFAVYMVNLYTGWMLEHGGLEGMEKRSREKGEILYGAVDRRPEFFTCPVEKGSRSLMNAVFRLPTEELEKKFVAEGAERRFFGLKGHRSVGGIRISMYNAIGPEVVGKVADFMEEFAKKNG